MKLLPNLFLMLIAFCSLNAEEKSIDLKSAEILLGEYVYDYDAIDKAVTENLLKKYPNIEQERIDEGIKALKKIAQLHNFSCKITKDQIIIESKARKTNFSYEVESMTKDSIVLKTKLTKFLQYNEDGSLYEDSTNQERLQVQTMTFQISGEDPKTVKTVFFQSTIPHCWVKKK